MSNTTTTVIGGFRVEDVTFHNARQQSEILKEGVIDEEVEKSKVEAPKSLTPEQVKTFYLRKIQNTNDEDEKRVYAKTIHWIDELSEVKNKLVKYELEEMKRQDSADTPDDIE